MGNIIDGMHECADNRDYPDDVRIEGGVLVLHYNNGDAVQLIPLSDIKETKNIEHGSFFIYMKDGRFTTFSANGKNGRFTIQEKFYVCGPNKMSVDTAQKLNVAFAHLKEIISAE
jgi:hypothetical protein